MYTWKKLWIVFSFALLPLSLSWADSFRHLNMENGLSSRRVFQITKDSTGFMWFGTNVGIDRFDGSEIKHYPLLSNNQQNTEGLNAYSTLTQDQTGLLWVSLKNGLIYCYNDLLDIFTLKIDLTGLFSEPPILNSIYFDTSNRLWLCMTSGLYLYDLEKETTTLISDLSFETVTRITQTDEYTFYVGTHKHLYEIKENSNNHSFFLPKKIQLPVETRIEYLYAYNQQLYIGTFSNGVYALNRETKEITDFSNCIPSTPVRSITTTLNQQLLIGLDGAGLYCTDLSGKQLFKRYVADEDDEYSLCGNTVSDLYVDERNCIWTSTSTNGISMLDPQYPDILFIKHEYKNDNSLLSNHVNAIYEDSDGDMWYATNNGASLYQPKINKWTHYLNDANTHSEHASVILSITEDGEKNIWVGGYATGAYMINKKNGTIKKLPSRSTQQSDKGVGTDHIFSIYAMGDSIWFSGIEGELTLYNRQTDTYTYYPLDCVGALIPGYDQTLLMAACGGLDILDLKTGEITRHTELNGIQIPLPLNFFFKRSNGDLWIRISTNQFLCYNQQAEESKVITIFNMPKSGYINNLVEDQLGKIWASTGKDIFCIDPETGNITGMNEYVNLEWGYYNSYTALLKNDGYLTFGTANGVIEFSPWFTIENKDSIQAIFTDFKLFNKSVIPGEKKSPLHVAINKSSSIDLKYEQNSFAFSFSAINFVYPYQIEYQTQLEGFDTDWQQADETHTVGYTNISPGKYLFKMKALNKYTHEVIGEKEIQIIINRPFWASNLAILIYSIFFLLLAYFTFLYIQNKIEERQSKEKIDFFVNIAHDIRTPVSLIKAPLSELEAQENFSEHGRKNIAIASHNAEKLHAMVTQLLDFQKADFSTSKLIISQIELNQYLREKVNNFSIAAMQKNINLQFIPDPDLQLIWLDQSKMDKIVDNLISNAIKYTIEGSVLVIVSHTKQEWILEIKDTGIGIPQGEQRNLFRKFYRAGNAINSKESGSGIGLLLTQKLVKLHRGNISFESNENNGSIFKISFPIKIDAMWKVEVDNKKETTRKKIVSPGKTTIKATILLAEDNKDMREYLSESLSKEYQVISVTDGKAAMEQAKALNPDIIISDILMPNLRGDVMCSLLKSSMETSHIPIILLSGLNERENIITGLESGADDYIIKPFDFSVLRVRIKNILQNREQQRQMILSPENKLEEVSYSNQLDKEFLDKAIIIIEQEMSNPDFSINEFCKALGMSRTSVYNKIKTLTDQAPNDFIRIIRLNKAKELLKTKKYSISEISLMVGFADPKYFSTSFKKQFGHSPSKEE
ncbi:ATP-binding protein [Parabacteroides sp. PF5-9]|uniref:hybrid sensor histidine kinase/response regulator transcription factor n=1 Tax=Parabacteroides sp. PF5-9 TaxID=1742404 RepID=UPI0024748EBA|nr:ATP-binding protein [Parabacteroides sp. PF5-9]MDH6358882.1 signal transduction histidine kinase/DNA-binding response OmpR family regulator/ligand-binding sensor domain-containing protein [Parabacteroides sp. PF5-9]